MTAVDQWSWWRSALADYQAGRRLAEIVETDPQSGFFRAYAGPNAYTPLAIWVDAKTQTLVCLHDGVKVAERHEIERLWVSAAGRPCTKGDYDHRRTHGTWPADLAPVKPMETVASTETSAVPALAQPGHNSGDPHSFETMRAQLLGDIADARAFFAKNPIKTKTDADRAENWRKRIWDAAKAADAKRKAEKKPHEEKVKEIDGQWFPLIREGEAAAKEVGGLADAWVRAEQDRLRKIAEDEARKTYEAERAAAEAERQRIAAEREAQMRDDPIAAMTSPEPEMPQLPLAPAPIVSTPKVLVGTSGRRRGVTAGPTTATITDLAAAAVYLASIKNEGLIDAVQKAANAAARAKVTMVGCRMSWETTEAAK